VANGSERSRPPSPFVAFLTRRALDLIRETESRDVAAILAALNSIVTP
jgi:hypothetical protein